MPCATLQSISQATAIKEMSWYSLNALNGLPVLVTPQSSTKTTIPLCNNGTYKCFGRQSLPQQACKQETKQFDHVRARTHTHTSAQNRPQPTWQAHECPVHQTRLRYVHHCWRVKYFKWYLEAAGFSCLCQGSNPVACVIASVQEFVFSRTSLCEKVELQDKSFHTTSCCQAAD